MDTIKLDSNHFLTRVAIPKQPEVKQSKQKVNHIWIYDRSGSMSYMLDGLAADLVEHYKSIDIGDIMSLGWFSGEGKFRFILKGFVKQSHDDVETFKRIIASNKSPIGTTCFSEILYDTREVVDEIYPLCSNFGLMFFTDGYPVVSDYTKEIRNIKEAIDNIKGTISKAIFVGYGSYYNKELMSDMSARIGGQLIHSSELEEFSSSMKDFIGAKASPRKVFVVPISFLIDKNMDVAFTLKDGVITQYSVEMPSMMIDEADEIYFITSSPPMDMDKINVQEILPGLYASAMIFSQKMHSDIALSILGKIGDVALVDRLYNAFTNDEYGLVEKELLDATFHEDKRYTDGRRLGYVPRVDRFCMLDLLEMLRDDKDTFFYPYHPEFKYKRTGVRTRQHDGYSEFKRKETNPACRLSDLTWNATRLNISILVKIDGMIELNYDCEKFGFAKVYPTWIFRNYTIVLDGNLNVTSLPVKLSEASFNTLKKEKIVKGDWNADEIYVINLKRIPVMNRKFDEVKALDYCSLLSTEKYSEALLKVMKWKKNEIDPDDKLETVALSNDQVTYLDTQGVTKNGYNPPKEDYPITDFYIAREFDVKMQKFSSLPSINAVLLKNSSGKKMTESEMMIWAAMGELPSEVKSISVSDSTSEKKLAVLWLEAAIENRKSILKNVRNTLNRTKFAILLGKKWFPDLTQREGATMNVAGFDFLFTMREIKVDM
jgi:hypothetical protein